MIYLHPWELDPAQPVLPMSRPARWRHRLNLARTESKLRLLLQRFRFGPVREFYEASQARALPQFVYGTRYPPRAFRRS